MSEPKCDKKCGAVMRDGGHRDDCALHWRQQIDLSDVKPEFSDELMSACKASHDWVNNPLESLHNNYAGMVKEVYEAAMRQYRGE